MRISDWRSDVCSSDLWLIIAAVLVTVMNNFSSPNEPQTLNYSDFIQQVKDGKVERVAVDGYVITGKRTDGDSFKPIRPAIQDNGMRSEERRVGKECVRTVKTRWSR